ILHLGSRVGAWYTYHDATAGGTQTPAMGDPFIPDACGHASMYCAHTTGSGFTDYGAGFGFDLNNDAGTKGIYDVGAFTGVAFWAKGTPFRLKVLTSATVPTAEGGTCATTQCSDNFGTAIAANADARARGPGRSGECDRFTERGGQSRRRGQRQRGAAACGDRIDARRACRGIGGLALRFSRLPARADAGRLRSQ